MKNENDKELKELARQVLEKIRNRNKQKKIEKFKNFLKES